MEVKDKVKQRRHQRLRSIRDASEPVYMRDQRNQPLPIHNAALEEDELPLYVDSEWKRRMEDPEYAWRHKLRTDPTLSGRDDRDEGGGPFLPVSPRSFTVKLMISAVLFGCLWGLFHSEQPWAAKGKQFVTGALSESYDFAKLSAWYSERFGGSPSFIPSFHGSTADEAVKVNAAKRTMFSPVHGQIVKPYDGSASMGVLLQTEASAPVYALDTGQIIFAGMKEDTGFTIIIRHPGGLESIYGSISEAQVHVNDWIKGGEAVGKASKEDQSKSTIYFAVTKDGHPVNPTDVVTFD
ncbi:peptidoglycan DD-metalloendopeptidase family protein [Paenibacillus hexagrammi]|uniref:Peptidoglycan DD-metalloendopeptidase family protein n=1 Tax=Paenibacillus hexagrammi TaxID=2908839 RepID=A0ABY3SDT7_9BACL|nr:peptidoglycan DD-metalloendopeptidase family protein [Paenibacillus sp. YPD9-1]UJF31997.1 peptidoglycan DD-metalloendopeptidase family protein [Paenibacillus sp. YPD9-1]